MASLTRFFGTLFQHEPPSPSRIDEEWWKGLSEEWKSILIINQNFQNQKVDIFKIQNEYLNRLNEPSEIGYSEMNKSLHSLNKEKRFDLSYIDFYERALRTKHLTKTDPIDLATLANLETIYMVNGPGNLTPLKHFPHLKVLIVNYCGVDNNLPLVNQLLNLEPLKYLKELKILHCTSPVLKTLKPIKGLIHLEELSCESSGITSISPLSSLSNLKRLCVDLNGISAASVSNLKNLEELSLIGCKQVPNLSKLKKLKKLSISEGEMAIVKASYRISNIDFLRKLTKLEFLDLYFTSYKGNLDILQGLPNLKAVALPPVSRSDMQDFKRKNQDCIIVNAYQFEY